VHWSRHSRHECNHTGHPLHLLRKRTTFRRQVSVRFQSSALPGGPAGSLHTGSDVRGRLWFVQEPGPLAKILAVRKSDLALRRGRQYLRSISEDGVAFGYPNRIGEGRMKSIVAWSRIMSNREVVCAINTHLAAARTAWVTIDARLHTVGAKFKSAFNGPDPGWVAGVGRGAERFGDSRQRPAGWLRHYDALKSRGSADCRFPAEHASVAPEPIHPPWKNSVTCSPQAGPDELPPRLRDKAVGAVQLGRTYSYVNT
jgi:hypothetical protein